VLQLRVYGDQPLMATLARRLEALPGARHISLHADETTALRS
jgi:hypothetical protein